jgi:hypothetical protein
MLGFFLKGAAKIVDSLRDVNRYIAIDFVTIFGFHLSVS